MSASTRPATGEQYEIAVGGTRAVITELAAGLRLFEVDGVALTETYDDDAIAPGAAGITLAPWPNRIAAGRWTQRLPDGGTRTQQLDITEPARGNAMHGLLRNTGYTPLEHRAESVTLSAGIYPQHGYPFHLIHEVHYAVSDDGSLHVRQRLTNRGSGTAPVALGAHPYLRVGDVPVADLTLRVDAATRLLADPRSLIPTGTAPVDGGEHDLRAGRRIGSLRMDSAYTDLALVDGEHRHDLRAPDGSGVQLRTGPECGYVHVFITDHTPGLGLAVALEPMSAPANAFNSGDGLRRLAPGEELTISWGLRRLPA
ncbi:aldose epimerase [Tersicoccus phoenicis]|uniref:Aldose epimerase n=1 Tax=Tersicoccus phoenicis TaxID=554083 RepID=A0A1R1L8D3_9MICC|nr:aldose 1-epimerase family protein [Tersicoccus phoenicis]OMH23795.1 aldose epimerase [Tersicoccus phoenicis]